MANKNNSAKQNVIKNHLDLLYLTPSEIRAKDIAALLEENKDLKIQLWEEMNVLELELPNENSVDFESIDINFKDPSDASFVKNRNIKTIFAINICEIDLDNIIPHLERLVEKFSGFVCEDSVDFTPVYAGSSKKE